MVIAIAFSLFAFLTSPLRLPGPTWLGVLTGGAALTFLFRDRTRILAPCFGGALAGILCSLLRGEGLPLPLALGLPLAIALAPAMLSGRPNFASPVLWEQALLLIAVLGLIVALAPGIASGWVSAAALNLQQTGNSDSRDTASEFPRWTFAVGMSSLILGGLFRLWKRA